MAESVRIEVLGPTRVVCDGSEVAFTRQDRRVLAALVHLCQGGALVESDLVEEYAWRRTPSQRALRSTVYRVRKALGDEVLITRRRSIGLGTVRTDLDDFLCMVATERADGDSAPIDEALALVRGRPFADLADHPLWSPVRDTWSDRIETVRDQKVAALEAAGNHVEAVHLLRAQVAANPLATDRWEHLVGSLLAQGRPVEASRAIEEARRALAEVGLELPPELRTVARAIVGGTARPPQTPAANQSVGAAAWQPPEREQQVQRLVQVLALQVEAIAVARLADQLDLAPADVDDVVAAASAVGLVRIVDGVVELLDRGAGEQSLKRLTRTERSRIARRLLHASAWADPRRAPFARLRLSLAAGDDSVDDCVRRFLTDVSPDRDTSIRGIVDAIDEFVESDVYMPQLSPPVHAVLAARRAMALRESGDLEGGRAAADSSYRLAVRSGDHHTVSEVVRVSRYPSTASVTDYGKHFEALARVWQPSVATTRDMAVIEAVLAFHELARGPVADGVARARTVLALCDAVGDPALRADVVPCLIYELNWDRSFIAEAEAHAHVARASGAVIGALGAQSYVLGGRMRRREITFDHPGVTELEMLGLEGGLWTMLPSLLTAVSRGILAADRAPLERLVASHLEESAPVANLATRVLEVHLQLLATPTWATIPAHELVGDPRRWDVSNPVDVALFEAARAVAQGDPAEARRQLALLDTPLLDATPSVLMVSRLPVAALVALGLGDPAAAASLLRLNMDAAGLDLCLLPAIHLGPAESWLALMAEVAGDPSAAALHEAAATRLHELGACVLELA